MSHTVSARVLRGLLHVGFCRKFLVAFFLSVACVGPTLAEAQAAAGSQSQPVPGRLFAWRGDTPTVTRRGAPLVDPPELGDGLLAYDLIETSAASELVLLLYSLQNPLATPRHFELAPNSAVILLGDGGIHLIEGRVRLHDMAYSAALETGLSAPGMEPDHRLSHNRLEVSAGAGADIDMIATITGTVLVSARAGRAELQIPDPASPAQRVFVSPGVGALFYPPADVRNIEIEPGADAEVVQLHSELGDLMVSPEPFLFFEAVLEYQQYREQFLRAYEVVFRDHALIQDLRRIDRARADELPLGFAHIMPDGSGRSLRDLSETETTTDNNELSAAAAELFRIALDFDRAMRRILRVATFYRNSEELADEVTELLAVLRNRGEYDRERLAAAYYGARLVSVDYLGRRSR